MASGMGGNLDAVAVRTWLSQCSEAPYDARTTKAAAMDRGGLSLAGSYRLQPPNRTPTVIGMNLRLLPLVNTSWKRPSANSPADPAFMSNPAPTLRPNLVTELTPDGTS